MSTFLPALPATPFEDVWSGPRLFISNPLREPMTDDSGRVPAPEIASEMYDIIEGTFNT